ncbi:glucokinase regulatory protein-like [Mytilus californianus]|uniref:glucokinase regulatory protein-like n=1 Tax=Mytilus californianus TaxID=6549 RepID=UPI002246BB3D|nr:glucokinase regulatory protein-like [Mytilus californianus]XP_052091076.1 glucokinase regulatory protein-like [Mytilus californianus]
MDVPITEARNPVTTTIDVASTDDIVQMLHMCDREIFNGWKQYKGLFHPETIATIQQISEVAVDILKKPGGMIVLSGCGTSGRIAFLIARNFNEVLRNSGREQCFRYLIAGRDKALFTSQEAPEDDPQCGIEMLKEVTEGRNRVLFIGITCGLSAPYVAGQLYYCMENLNIYTPVLLGFNPCNLARNIKIEKWDKTFLQVVRLMENEVAENKAYILNPVVGPEQITGSSRMKSGTATKILLETIFVSCVKAYENIPSNIEAHLKSYQYLCEVVYKETSSISKLVQLAGNSLKAGGTISYIGWDSLGVMGMIDASECPPTYGASLSDIRGFVETGYKLLNNTEGDLSPLGKYYRISIDEFQSDVVPGLKESDLVILLMKDESCSVSDILWKSTCKKACVSFYSAEKIQEDRMDCTVSIDLSNLITEPLGNQHYKSWGQLYKELSTKWILNAVTTGAHILKGKVYQNIMVDLKVSNNKLFFRAVGIIQNFSNLPKEMCQEYLLKSIYMTDDLSDDLKSLQVKDHIVKATSMEKVVPTALVATILKCNIDDARKLLLQHHVIRTAISDIINNRTTV